MRLIFLGTGTSQGIPIIGCSCEVCRSQNPHDQRLRTSAFLEADHTHLLLDAGPDLRQQLLREKITKIDAVLVTHEHKDHIGGMDDLRPIIFMQKSALDIYASKRVLGIIAKDYDYAFARYKYPGVPDLKLHAIEDKSFYINNIEIIPIRVKHLNLSILGYRIRNLAYITDASFIAPKEKEKLLGLDVLVINALRIEEHYSHFNLAGALQLIEELQPRQAYLTHIAHSMGLYENIQHIVPQNVKFAFDGMKIEMT